MHFDAYGLFSDQQAITATAASTDHVNLGPLATPPGAPAPLKRDLGGGQNIPIRIQVVEDFNNLTSLRADIEVDDNPSFSSPRVAGSSGTVALADLKAGKVLAPTLAPLGADEQYIRINYTVTGTAPTAGKITAGFVAGHQTNG